jgi:hypothetical protein
LTCPFYIFATGCSRKPTSISSLDKTHLSDSWCRTSPRPCFLQSSPLYTYWCISNFDAKFHSQPAPPVLGRSFSTALLSQGLSVINVVVLDGQQPGLLHAAVSPPPSSAPPHSSPLGPTTGARPSSYSTNEVVCDERPAAQEF